MATEPEPPFLLLSKADAQHGLVTIQRRRMDGESLPTPDKLEHCDTFGARAVVFTRRRASALATDIHHRSRTEHRNAVDDTKVPLPGLTNAARRELLGLVVEFPGLVRYARDLDSPGRRALWTAVGLLLKGREARR